jgi:hypothetical protein
VSRLALHDFGVSYPLFGFPALWLSHSKLWRCAKAGQIGLLWACEHSEGATGYPIGGEECNDVEAMPEAGADQRKQSGPGSASRCIAVACAPTEPDVRNYRIRFLKEWVRYAGILSAPA